MRHEGFNGKIMGKTKKRDLPPVNGGFLMEKE